MDKILHGICANENIRLVAISAKDLITEAQGIFNLSRVATAALGRQLMMTTMMASRLKNPTECVTTIIGGNGLSGNMVCTGRYGALVKGYTPNPLVELPLREDGKIDVSGYVGRTGKLTVITDLSLKEPYVGTCNLVSGEIAEDFAQYFMVSEQQPSLVYLGANLRADTNTVNAGCGLWISALPDCPDYEVDRIVSKTASIAALTQRVAAGEELDKVMAEMLCDIEFRITETQQPKYLCDCNIARLERALISIGAAELTNIIEQDGGAEITCQFCNKKYHFERDALIKLREESLGHV